MLRVSLPLTYFFLLSILLCSSPIMSLFLFLISTIFLASTVCSSNSLVSLLVLLVYLGGLMVLFAYFWMFIPYSPSFSPFYSLLFFIAMLSSFGTTSPPASVMGLLCPTSFLLFLAAFLFWVLLVVVLVIDPSLGSFST